MSDMFVVVGEGTYDASTGVLDIFAPALAFGLDVIANLSDEQLAEVTTWDTEEVIRWIDNEQSLYQLTHHLARLYPAEYVLARMLRTEMPWESVRYLNVDLDNVDWNHVALYLLEDDDL